jgi:secretory lipase
MMLACLPVGGVVRVRRLVVGVLALLLFSGGLASPAQAAAAWPLHPDVDPFYAQPSPMPQVAPGSVLDSRSVTIRALAIPLPVRAWQVKYLSTDTRGVPAANIATVIKPLFGQRKLVSYQTAYDGLDADCAPSYAFATGIHPPAYEEAAIVPLLLAGYTVVTADYEGPDYQWTAGVNSGHGVLDGIRAAQRFTGLGSSTPTALWGYSGGALASQWANELAAGYAPELNLVGVAAGGVPASVEAIARAIDGTALSGVYFGATVGLSRAYPEIGIDSLLNARGRAAFDTLGRQCIGEFTLSFAFQRMRDYVTVPELLDVPAIKAVIAENTMGQRLPDAPTYIYQGTHDELAITPPVDALVGKYCGMGAAVTYVKIPGEHITTAATGVPGALAYVNARLAGLPVPSNCQASQ